MKKNVSLLFLMFTLLSQGLSAQVTEIYYPSFKNDDINGFKRQHVTVDAEVESKLFARQSALPTEEQLGYAPGDDQRRLNSRGFANDTNYITDSYAVIDAVDLSAYPSTNTFELSFYTLAQYANGTAAEFNVLISTDYVDDVTTCNWDDVTSQLDTLDKAIGSDAEWTKSTLDLETYKTNTITLAFQYKIDTETVISTSGIQAGDWNVAEVKFTTTEVAEERDTIASNNFNYTSLFTVANFTITDAQAWVQQSELRPGLVDEDSYKSISAKANSGTNITPLETWTILNPVNCLSYEDIKLSFWNRSRYQIGGDSELSIKLSIDYIEMTDDSITAINNATWTDITENFTLDQSIGYDSDWTLSEGDLNIDSNSNVVIAFVYTCTDSYETVEYANRPATWQISDVQFTGIKLIPTAISENHMISTEVYPNPTTGTIHFSEEVNNVKVYTLQGQLVMQNVESTTQIDLSMLNKGMYLIASENMANETSTSRIILQ